MIDLPDKTFIDVCGVHDANCTLDDGDERGADDLVRPTTYESAEWKILSCQTCCSFILLVDRELMQRAYHYR